MGRAFSLKQWFDFIDRSEAFDCKVVGKKNPKRIVVVCTDGVDIFNEELYYLALDLLPDAEDWDEYYSTQS